MMPVLRLCVPVQSSGKQLVLVNDQTQLAARICERGAMDTSRATKGGKGGIRRKKIFKSVEITRVQKVATIRI